jgi:hypothetical protein
MVNNVPRK